MKAVLPMARIIGALSGHEIRNSKSLATFKIFFGLCLRSFNASQCLVDARFT